MKFPTIISISESEFNLDSLLAKITLPTSGASAIFTGIVRGRTSGNKNPETIFLEYEAYQQMAMVKMRQIADEIRQKWPAIEGLAILQRVGRLYPGTPSTVIACTASHRDTGVFEAAKYGINRLKEIVPIWKKETSLKGEEWVEGNYHPEPGE